MNTLNPCLPQNDPDRARRDEYLNLQKQLYEYDYKYLPPLVLMKTVPAVENFSAQYIAERVLASSELIPNMLAAKVKSFFDPLDSLQDYEDFFTVLPLPQVAKVYQTNTSFAEQRLSGANPMVIRLLDEKDPRSRVLEHIESFKPDFEPLFNIPQELAAGNIYITDYTGTDPNYRGPALVQGGAFEKGRKYLPKPLAFFWWQSTGIGDRGNLVPIAIQLNASSDRNIYTPTDSKVYSPFESNPLDWLFAKLCVQIADANHHEMNSHLCRTHFVMEPIAIGTAHQLSDNHPLSLLLKPHFIFMLANNQLGQQRLINPNGIVDQLLAGTLGESMELVKDAYESWNIKDFAFPKEIANRGMDDVNRLPHYPYRDDGMLVWTAIRTFVSDYLHHFYPDPQDIIDDTELQAWARELAEGGKVKEMPESFANIDDLVEIVTTIIFICAPQHSALNYAQYDYMTLASNMPLAAYRDIPVQPSHQDRPNPTETATSGHSTQTTQQEITGVQIKEKTTEDLSPQKQTTEKQITGVQIKGIQTTAIQKTEVEITETEILKLLPPYKRSADQLQSLFVLSAYRYDRLGYYDKSFQELYRQKPEDVFVDENSVINAIVRQFQQNLNIVEQKIDANNRKRIVPYPYLKPSLIINSISI